MQRGQVVGATKVSSRTRARTAQAAAVQPFLQDAQNLDLISMVLQLLLDSTKGRHFALVDVEQSSSYTDHAGVVQHRTYKAHRYAGGIFEDLGVTQCVHALVQALSSVCRLWDEVVVAEVHGGAKELLPPRALRTLKYKARTIDMTPCIATFLRDMDKYFKTATIRNDEGEHIEFLPLLYEYKFGSKESFAEAVADAYSHFFVIKALETLAQDRLAAVINRIGMQSSDAAPTPPAVATSEFAERCQPTQIIDLMWHAHILSPRAYSVVSYSLIGAIIDHDPAYYNLNDAEHESKLMPKLQKVFKYEMRHLDEFDCGWVSLVNNSMNDFAEEISESMNDPGCG